ncbi:hypothetical protein BU24DRAFT_481913 [Aaosphaeria arxii CBS 175.79]|uniref:Xylanolytic transcriptional activator regulatory domain-containing protein n=1 Tax=Aaosphaeria arxii CBS 175.79 TaxID=1450172 RepID=A0A6A5XNV8_9PLEO|nr:uncharacterized protein BU24DRAFT_481913 [Aaosphaeria arxii CBS 175.79]KAF2014451.1 hypothetical protein BU24DRAFT_481913 [Aaosphaeria arxii CBS 175.79]
MKDLFDVKIAPLRSIAGICCYAIEQRMHKMAIKRGLPCSEMPPKQTNTASSRAAERPATPEIPEQQHLVPQAATPGQSPTSTAASYPDAQALLDLYSHGHDRSQDAPNIIQPVTGYQQDFIGVEPIQLPDLTMWMPEMNWLGEVDLFNNDFAFPIDQISSEQQDTSPESSVPANLSNGVSNPFRGQGDAKKRHAIFKRSPWFWVPDQNQHAFSENAITIDSRNVDIASSPHQPCSPTISIPDRLSLQARDRIFQLISRTAQNQVSVLSFPSADCLDKLINVGIAKRIETDAWIHPFSFDSSTARPEYLTALVAAGCVCFGIPSVSRTGLVFQEIVRVALNKLVELDNSVIRDLQYLQAFMIWLDIGVFCGFRRKMEIAESNLLPLVTGLRRAGKFDRVTYTQIVPSMDDSVGELQRKWRSWVEQESFKRLVYHLFEHDVNVALVKHRSPLMSYSEMLLPLPSARDLWLAPTAEIWRERFLSLGQSNEFISLRCLLKQETTLRRIPPSIDLQVARSAYLNGLGAQIWEYLQQGIILDEDGDASSQLWLQSRQQRLGRLLENTNVSLQNSSPISCVLYQFLQMYLHVNMDSVTRFAGKFGEEAANQAATHLKDWARTKQARKAVLYAGQVLRCAQAITPYQTRGSETLMIYHSVIVLWTYSMISRDLELSETIPSDNVPREGDQSSNDCTMIVINASRRSNQQVYDAFVEGGAGTPFLNLPTHQDHCQREEQWSTSDSQNSAATTQQLFDVRCPEHVMLMGVKTLEILHPGIDSENRPPLVRALCKLLKDLGNI